MTPDAICPARAETLSDGSRVVVPLPSGEATVMSPGYQCVLWHGAGWTWTVRIYDAALCLRFERVGIVSVWDAAAEAAKQLDALERTGKVVS